MSWDDDDYDIEMDDDYDIEMEDGTHSDDEKVIMDAFMENIISGKIKAHDYFTHNKEIVGLLTEQKSECKTIDTLFESGKLKFLGKGKYGEVYEFSTERKNYVIKSIDIRRDKLRREGNPNPRLTISEHSKKVKNYHISKKHFKRLNTNDGLLEETYKPESFFTPLYAELCHYTHDIEMKSNDDKKEVILYQGDSAYVCKNSTYSEYLIGILLSELYQKGISINFVETYGFSTCIMGDVANVTTSTIVKQYIFMEKVSGTIQNFLIEKYFRLKESDYNSILIQIFFSIYAYQNIYNIVHGDLHAENIMYSMVDENTVYNNSKLLEKDYYCYIINDQLVTFPKSRYIIKIADFGLSVKYSDPKVGYYKVCENGLSNSIPNWANSFYDCMLATCNLCRCLKKLNIDIPELYLDSLKFLLSGISRNVPDNFDDIINEINKFSLVGINRLTNKNIFQTGRIKPNPCREAEENRININSLIQNIIIPNFSRKVNMDECAILGKF